MYRFIDVILESPVFLVVVVGGFLGDFFVCVIFLVFCVVLCVFLVLFVFVPCLVCPMLPVSLGCPFRALLLFGFLLC